MGSSTKPHTVLLGDKDTRQGKLRLAREERGEGRRGERGREDREREREKGRGTPIHIMGVLLYIPKPHCGDWKPLM